VRLFGQGGVAARGNTAMAEADSPFEPASLSSYPPIPEVGDGEDRPFSFSGIMLRMTISTGKSRMRPIMAVALAVVVGGFHATAARAADARHGADLAQRWCSSCHLVDSEHQKQADADVPSFAAIAKKPDFTPEKVAFFLLDPHPKMPNFSLSRNETADIAAYIGSLR
jgi:mono/diheme cytochrome c family protein